MNVENIHSKPVIRNTVYAIELTCMAFLPISFESLLTKIQDGRCYIHKTGKFI